MYYKNVRSLNRISKDYKVTHSAACKSREHIRIVFALGPFDTGSGTYCTYTSPDLFPNRSLPRTGSPFAWERDILFQAY